MLSFLVYECVALPFERGAEDLKQVGGHQREKHVLAGANGSIYPIFVSLLSKQENDSKRKSSEVWQWLFAQKLEEKTRVSWMI
ncbi:uncharacterized protein BT62DRAFT_934199 [Guyanagaster necrorhizus]|uniref:Uncharacterized protein n=1 Tax=Guyanagaster necrorhizus TaxID=856835 RepID=A0A9P7VPT7_9AGAR|nr:uncharacterized protein BT62DRAFT_934199 [Guyanagaster necrorhizus MCA 3950]KAG7444557.1 hypothetical protein BT62DRAFT_934199 [Guyanagaster necrorhizus MCA 3950]